MSICYPDTTDWGCALTPEQIAALDPEVKARSEALAWQTLQRLSGGNIAICPQLVRPCSVRCAAQTWYTAPVTGASQSPWPSGNGAFQPNINANGQWVNSCGCSNPDSCSCTSVRRRSSCRASWATSCVSRSKVQTSTRPPTASTTGTGWFGKTVLRGLPVKT